MPTRPLILGILNLTPDSFSDGGRHPNPDAALLAARQMIAHGADILDLGGESTRPGARRIDAEEQLSRVLPVIKKLQSPKPAHSESSSAAPGSALRLSIDTTLTEVARAALDAGVSMLNDISAGRDPRNHQPMLDLAAERGVPIILMHMQGEPATMQNAPHYSDVVAEVRDFLLRRADAALAAGVRRENIILDPGIGFGKSTEHNLQLLANLRAFVDTGFRICLGASRKRFLGEITHADLPTDRVAATCATTALGVAAGVHLFRVHDVKENRHAADVTFATLAHQNP